jgi:predicted nucleic acid-binding protein
MNIIVDTCIWSLAFRRKKNASLPEVIILTELIKDSRVQILGPIRQEVFSGIKSKDQFLLLQDKLRAFPDLQLFEEDYEKAAESFNLCRSNGIQGSNTDFLICAVALRSNMPVYTIDNDFKYYQKFLDFSLYGHN